MTATSFETKRNSCLYFKKIWGYSTSGLRKPYECIRLLHYITE